VLVSSVPHILNVPSTKLLSPMPQLWHPGLEIEMPGTVTSPALGSSTALSPEPASSRTLLGFPGLWIPWSNNGKISESDMSNLQVPIVPGSLPNSAVHKLAR